MRQLTLIRHAKSSWKNPELIDFDRPLNKRGKRDLPGIARRVAHFGLMPDIILSSGAKRAITTATEVAQALAISPEQIQQVPELYESCYETLLHTLQNQPDHYRHIMLFGHNPGLQQLGFYLTQEPLEKFPTGGVMHIHLSITNWSELAEHCGTLTLLDYPKRHLNEERGE